MPTGGSVSVRAKSQRANTEAKRTTVDALQTKPLWESAHHSREQTSETVALPRRATFGSQSPSSSPSSLLHSQPPSLLLFLLQASLSGLSLFPTVQRTSPRLGQPWRGTRLVELDSRCKAACCLQSKTVRHGSDMWHGFTSVATPGTVLADSLAVQSAHGRASTVHKMLSDRDGTCFPANRCPVALPMDKGTCRIEVVHVSNMIAHVEAPQITAMGFGPATRRSKKRRAD